MLLFTTCDPLTLQNALAIRQKCSFATATLLEPIYTTANEYAQHFVYVKLRAKATLALHESKKL